MTEDCHKECQRGRPAITKIVTKNVKENDKPWMKIDTKNAKEDDQP